MLATILFAGAASVQAQNTLQGVNFFAVGSDSAFPVNFNPGGSPASFQFKNDGTSGDVTSGDSIYSVTVTLTPNITNVGYKAASNSFNPINAPSGADQTLPNTGATGEVTFFLDTAIGNDGFFPAAGIGDAEDGVLYNSLIRSTVDDASTTPTLIGSWQVQLDGANFSDSAASAIVMTDVDNDGIYLATTPPLNAGTYNFQITLGSSFGTPTFRNNGLSTGGGDLNFSILTNGNTALVELDAVRGRVRAADTTALFNQAPFYAQSSAWGTGFTTLEDLGSPTAGVYAKEFVVPAAGNYSVRVRPGFGIAKPFTGDVPFTTTVANQNVRVVFDTNTYNDGFFPASNIVIVTDAASRETLIPFTSIQFAGSFQSDFGFSGFEVPAAAFSCIDQGDGIWTFSTPFGAPTNAASPSPYKAVFTRASGTETGFALQIGGLDDNLTINGNNANVLGFTYAINDVIHGKADARTGRIRMEANPSSTNPIGNPQRNGAYLPASLDVENWMLHSF